MTTPRDFSPCGITLDEDRPTLARHPERYYSWIADANIVVPEVLLVPLHEGDGLPLGTLWIVSEQINHFNRAHAESLRSRSSSLPDAAIDKLTGGLPCSFTHPEMPARVVA